MDKAGPTTILYDRDCGFCRWALAKVLAWDRRGALVPVAIQDPAGQRLLGAISEDERLASWHLVEDGAIHSAGAAFSPLLRALPGGRPLARAAEAMPSAVERAYRLVAGNRNRLGPLVTAGAKRRADKRIEARSA